MSNAMTKAERSAAKDIRQGVAAQREHPQVDKKRKRADNAKKQWVIYWQWGPFRRHRWGRYLTEAEGLFALEAKKRKLGGGSWTLQFEGVKHASLDSSPAADVDLSQQPPTTS